MLRLTIVAVLKMGLVSAEIVLLADVEILLGVGEELGFDKTVVSVCVDARLLRLPVAEIVVVILAGDENVVLKDERELLEEFRLRANVACELVTGTYECSF